MSAKIIRAVCTFCFFILVSNQVYPAVTLYEESKGWYAGVSGAFPVFLVASDTDGGEQAIRVMSGFNPANLTFDVTAPEEQGLVVSGKLQINSHLQGAQVQNSGLFESRIADIQIEGDFATLNIGKGFGIFNSSAIDDIGSGLGVGLLGGGADTGNATNGHIGTGYVYANFNPRLMLSQSWDQGLSYKLGLFNPEEPTNATGNVETPYPRIEGQINVQHGNVEMWSGFMWQSVKLMAEEVDYSYQGLDIGVRVIHKAVSATFSFTKTKGIGADGLYGIGGISDAEVDGAQWYLEGAFVQNKTTYGASYGVGSQDAHITPFIVPEIENTLLMVFVHHRLTSHLRMMVEVQDYESETSKVTTNKYKAFALGAQLDF